MKKPVLALIAHERMMYRMLQMVKENEDLFSSFNLLTTESIGCAIRQKTGLNVEIVKNAPVMGAMVDSGGASAVIFFRDPVNNRLGEAELNAMLRICDVNDIPVATNRTSARAVMQFLLMVGKSAQRCLVGSGKIGVLA